ncbi:DUF6059 family protein [Nonomuraea insulae]|uniref:DUF6059 family protein n=1 Tax=Nonomuraea insulae TaxID=1616787 RepID=A0ABW1CSL9_9ACTN
MNDGNRAGRLVWAALRAFGRALVICGSYQWMITFPVIHHAEPDQAPPSPPETPPGHPERLTPLTPPTAAERALRAELEEIFTTRGES